MKQILSMVLVLIVLSACGQPPSQPVVQATPPALEVIRPLASVEPFNVDTSTQGQVLNLEQTIDGVSVTLHWAYRDVNRVVVGYTVQSAAGLRPQPDSMRLTSAAGDRFQRQAGNVMIGPSDTLSTPIPSGYGAFLHQFRMQTPRDIEGPVDLRFEVEVAELQGAEAEPQGSIIASSSAGTIVQLQPVSEVSRTGPFTFEFTLPTN
jgi:hypothetical protein